VRELRHSQTTPSRTVEKGEIKKRREKEGAEIREVYSVTFYGRGGCPVTDYMISLLTENKV